VARRYRDGAAVHDGRAARVEHGDQNEDGQTRVRVGRRRRTQRHSAAHRRVRVSEVTDGIRF